MMLYGSLLPIGILFFSNRLCITCINIFFFRNLVEEGSRDWTKLMCWQFDETPAFLLFLQPISVRVRCSESILSHTPLKKKLFLDATVLKGYHNLLIITQNEYSSINVIV